MQVRACVILRHKFGKHVHSYFCWENVAPKVPTVRLGPKCLPNTIRGWETALSSNGIGFSDDALLAYKQPGATATSSSWSSAVGPLIPASAKSLRSFTMQVHMLTQVVVNPVLCHLDYDDIEHSF